MASSRTYLAAIDARAEGRNRSPFAANRASTRRCAAAPSDRRSAAAIPHAPRPTRRQTRAAAARRSDCARHACRTGSGSAASPSGSIRSRTSSSVQSDRAVPLLSHAATRSLNSAGNTTRDRMSSQPHVGRRQRGGAADRARTRPCVGIRIDRQGAVVRGVPRACRPTPRRGRDRVARAVRATSRSGASAPSINSNAASTPRSKRRQAAARRVEPLRVADERVAPRPPQSMCNRREMRRQRLDRPRRREPATRVAEMTSGPRFGPYPASSVPTTHVMGHRWTIHGSHGVRHIGAGNTALRLLEHHQRETLATRLDGGRLECRTGCRPAARCAARPPPTHLSVADAGPSVRPAESPLPTVQSSSVACTTQHTRRDSSAHCPAQASPVQPRWSIVRR